MTFQTLQDDSNNRDKKLDEALKTKLRSIWLGMGPPLGTPYSLTISLLLKS
jgi:hypothetical protein